MTNKHGYGNTKTYSSWNNMIARCTESRGHAQYKDYGGRGINPCASIRESVLNLVEIIGDRPNGKSLDRIDNDRGYYCGKCDDCGSKGNKINIQWSDRGTQNSNKRIYKANKTGYKGVYQSYRKFHASVRRMGKLNYLGSYKTALEASLAIKEWEKQT